MHLAVYLMLRRKRDGRRRNFTLLLLAKDINYTIRQGSRAAGGARVGEVFRDCETGKQFGSKVGFRAPLRGVGMSSRKNESACKPGSVLTVIPGPDVAVRLKQPTREQRGHANAPHLVLLRVGFAMPRDVVLARGALLPHRFTLTTHVSRRRSAVCSLLHCPSAHAAQALPGTVPYGARTFLEMLAHLATIRPTR